MAKLERLSALALNCTLKATSADEPSSTDKLLNDMLAAMEPYGVQGEVVRVADHDIKPGVRSDEGPGEVAREIWTGALSGEAARDRQEDCREPRSDHDETTAPEPQPGLQGEGGDSGHQG